VPIDSGATAWVLASAALVLIMTPGVAFFYAGMVRRTNVLSVLMQGLAGMAIVSVLWVCLGFSLAFSGTNAFVGNLRWVGIPNTANPLMPAIPLAAFAVFQMMFAVITPVLVTGAGVERWRFSAYAVFVGLWSLLVYAPVAHWVFDPHGWLAKWGVRDFAGGTVVHTNAGAAALAVAIMLGRRRGWPARTAQPHNLPLVMCGLALLWFGWLGFNGGSAYSAGALAATAALNTQAAASGAVLAWMLAERLRYGKATTLGAASGAVTGLVAITPAAGYVSPLAAVGIGLIAGFLCQLAVGLKRWFNLDDSLDVAAVHLGGGVIGTVCVGLFASPSVNPAGVAGLFFGGGYRPLVVQAGAAGAVAVYSLLVSVLLAGVVNLIVRGRVNARQEYMGLDLSQHGEAGYDFGPAGQGAAEPNGAARHRVEELARHGE
jgi:ammonium transporter, Amt family